MEDNLYPNADMLPAMLISKQPTLEKFNSELSSGKYFGQVKKDGYWYQLEKTKTGEVYLFSRSISKKTGYLSEKIGNVPHIKKWAECLPNDTTLIGEVYYPEKKSNDVTKIMGCLPNTAINRQTQNNSYGGLIHYYIHDIIKYAGKSLLDVSFGKRYDYLFHYVGEDQVPHFIEYGNVFENNLQETLDKEFTIGEEGMVFKLKDGLYLPGKRPPYNFKAKTECTFDVVIADFIEPEKVYSGKEIETWKYWITEGKKEERLPIQEIKTNSCSHFLSLTPVTKAYYYGWKAGVVVGAWIDAGDVRAFVNIGRVSSGMTDFLREDMSKNPNEYLGKAIEVQAMSVDKKSQTLRHARFLRMRKDKNSHDCKIVDIF